MNTKQLEGEEGEKEATSYLIKQGYKIICKNFRCNQGEIDIVAENTEYLVFIEVKTRTSFKYGEAKEAVDKRKQKHIYEAAKYYLYKNEMEECFIRIDVIEVYMMKGQIRINHIKQIM